MTTQETSQNRVQEKLQSLSSKIESDYGYDWELDNLCEFNGIPETINNLFDCGYMKEDLKELIACVEKENEENDDFDKKVDIVFPHWARIYRQLLRRYVDYVLDLSMGGYRDAFIQEEAEDKNNHETDNKNIA